MAELKTNTPHAPPACLDLGTIEAIASERRADPKEQSHLDSCEVCRTALDEFLANVRLLVRMRRVMGSGFGAEPKSALPEDLVPGYRILEEISRGAQGVVYKAVQERTKRVVALKMLLQGTFATEKQRRRFEREVEIAAALKHPGIVTVYDGTPVRGGRYAYAMEFIDGVRLDEWRPPGKNDRERRGSIIRLFIQICEAAQYAHNNGVMHRDLKPANIIVDQSGNAHVLDFGIAKAMGEPHGPGAGTMTNEFAGTLAYASPEQVAGDPGQVDARADVYSLGVMLYLVICGRPPYSLEGSILDIAARIRTDEPVRPRSIDPSIGADLEAVMLHALRKEPSERYQSPGALGRDLARCLAGEAIIVKRDSGWYMLRKTIARHRRLISALLLMALLAIASIAAVAYSTIQTMIARGHELSEREHAAAETVRVGALSDVLRQIMPPPRVPQGSIEARQVDEGLQRLRGKIALGYAADDPVREAAAQTILALAYRDRGTLAFSEESLRLALCRLVAEHGEEHPAVAQAMHDLAGVLLDRQRGWEAEKYARQAIRVRSAVLGPDDPKTGESHELLARVLVGAGKPSEALEDVERAAEIISSAGGGDGLPMARSLDTLASVLVALDRGPEAERPARRALTIRLARLSDDEPEVCESLIRMAEILERGGTAESGDLVRATGTADTRGLSARLRSIASELGTMSTPEKEPIAASRMETALDGLLALKRSLVGERSRAVGQTLAGMAWRLLDDYKFQAAEKPLREAISILEEQYGPDDLVVANCLERLGDSLIWQLRFSEAADCYAQQLRIWRAQPGAALEGINMALCQREMARNLTRAGRYDEAIANFQEAIAAFATNCGPMHHSRGLAMSQYSRALLGTGRVEEAEAMARQGRDIAMRNPSLPEDQRMQVDAALGLVLIRQGHAEEAEPLLVDAEKYCVANSWDRVNPGQPDLAAIQSALAQIRAARERGAAPDR